MVRLHRQLHHIINVGGHFIQMQGDAIGMLGKVNTLASGKRCGRLWHAFAQWQVKTSLLQI